MNVGYLKHVARAALFVGVSILVTSPSIAQTPADNTKANAQDRSKGAVTADQQKETAADRDVASRIRQAVVGDESLSTYAHNVKIVVRDGHVTLKGPVRSKDERKTVEAKAIDVAGAGHVTNQITIAPAH
ncbi:MAG TPA: BON domain-containing protein [Vicinamibacterales bacterium]|nr:BON domain-containing protein [Vicinamibacterales bacterium]